MKMNQHSSFWGVYPALVWIGLGIYMATKANDAVYSDRGAGFAIGGLGLAWALIWLVIAFKKPNL
jgi:hypothetical protein